MIRQKGHTDVRTVQKGDIVLVQDPKSIRGQWKLGMVENTVRGRADKVRNLTIRCKAYGENPSSRFVHISRSAHRVVVILPVEER